MAWYNTPGKEQDVGICTRVSFARNLTDHPFPSRLDAAGAREILSLIGELLEQNGFTKSDFADISRTMAYALVEQGYVAPAFVKQSLPHALFRNEPCHLSATVCGEDHVEVQAILPGLSLRDAHEAAGKIELLLDERFDLAFDERLGYLTPSIGRLGTAMHPSVTLCLPLLAETGHLGALACHLHHLGFHLHGLYGEDLHSPGGLYQVIPQTSLGLSEEEALGKMETTVARIIEKERTLRTSLSEADRNRMTDRILRAEGVLRYAHVLPARETLDLLSLVRLGIAMGLITDIPIEALTSLLIETMPATLTLASPSPVTTDQALDRYRAEVVKERLAAACGV